MSSYFHTFMFTFGLEKSVEDELNLNFSLSYSLVHNFAMIKFWNQQFLFATLVTHKKMINYAINWPWSEHRARKKLSRRWSMIQLRDLLNCFSFFFFFSFLSLYVFSFFFFYNNWRSYARGTGRSISVLFIALLISSLMDSTLGQ